MTTCNATRNDSDLHECLNRFASNAARLAGLQTQGTITPEQAARQIGEMYFELSMAAARSSATH